MGTNVGVMPRMLGLLAACLIVGCASGTRNSSGGAVDLFAEVEQRAVEKRTEDLNQQLLLSAAEAGGAGVAEYVVGPDDVLKVEVFGVPEMSRSVRVDNSGQISLPLVGQFEVSGLTPRESEILLARGLDDYVRNPQVSVSIEEYRSLQFTVVGAVSSPQTYTSTRNVSLLEALGMAGGLTAEAGSLVTVADRVRDLESGKLMTRDFIVDLNDLLSDPSGTNVPLGLNAIINVPKAGVVYVEGAVARPGAVAKRADTTVLGAVAMAGGLAYEANARNVKVMRRGNGGQWQTIELNYNTLRDDPGTDILLADGDIIVVEQSLLKSAVRDFNFFALPGLILFSRF